MATVPTSSAGPMIFKQSEATAAKRTWVFHMTLAATGADFTGGAGVAATISKAGGAFGAVDGATAITELTNGWYKIVHAALDLDTVGCLGVRVTGTLADTLNVTHQVTVLDLNVATVAPTAGSIASSSFAAGAITGTVFATDALTAAALKADAITEIQSGLATTSAIATLSHPSRSRTAVLGTLTSNASTSGQSLQDSLSTVVTVAGTFGGSTVTVEYSPNPAATVPQWLAVANGAFTANGSVTISVPTNAIRATMTSAGTSSVVVTAEIAYPV